MCARCSARESWTAVSNGALGHHLGENPAERLRYVAIVYQAISASNVANKIYGAPSELACSATPCQGQLSIAVLQKRFRERADPLRNLIARLGHPVD